MGLSAEEAQRQVISGPPNGHEARAISIVYQYPASLEGEELVHSGLAVPVPGETGSIGFIAIYSRSPHVPLRGGDDPRARGALQAGRAGDRERAPLQGGAAARRPRRAHRAAQPPLLPRDARARGGARASLRTPAGADRLRPRRLQGDQRPDRPPLRATRFSPRPPSGCARRSERPTSRAESAATSSPSILPESSTDDADQLYHRLRGAVSSRPVGQAGRLFISAGNRRAPARRRSDELLRAGRRGALPRQGARQGTGRRGGSPKKRSRPARTPASPPRGRAGSP